MSLLTPFKLEADQAKTSLFLARVSTRSTSSSFDKLPPMMTFLFGMASSSATDFVSSWSLRSVLPFGMSGGSVELDFAVSTELMLY